MAENRLIGGYPVIGIRPTIDGRRGPLRVSPWRSRPWIWRGRQKNYLKQT